MFKKHIQSGIKFLKFIVVGISNTIISLIVYYLLLYLGINYIVSNIVAFFISVLNAFYWNRRYVFNSVDSSWAGVLIKTYVSYGGSFILGLILMIVFVELLSITEVIAPLLTLLITVPLNFLLNKFWIFH